MQFSSFSLPPIYFFFLRTFNFIFFPNSNPHVAQYIPLLIYQNLLFWQFFWLKKWSYNYITQENIVDNDAKSIFTSVRPRNFFFTYFSKRIRILVYLLTASLILIVWGGLHHFENFIKKKWPFSRNGNTDWGKQISLFDTVFMTNT